MHQNEANLNSDISGQRETPNLALFKAINLINYSWKSKFELFSPEIQSIHCNWPVRRKGNASKRQ